MKDTERHNYIGDHIRKLREEKGWTQQVLGKKLGKKTSTISAYETDAKLPSVDCLIEMAELFDVSLDTLVYGDRSNLISIRALSCLATRAKRTDFGAYASFFGKAHNR